MSTQPGSVGQTGYKPAGGGPARDKGIGGYVKLGVIGVVVILVLVFVFQNTHSVKLTFLGWDFNLQVWAMLLVMLVIGFIGGVVTMWLMRRRASRK